MQVPPAGLQIKSTRANDGERLVMDATQVPLHRDVLLVGLAPGVLPSSPGARALVREGQVLAQLHHANIIRLFDLREADDQIWLILEKIDGIPLRELSCRSLEPEAIVAIGIDLARALAHGHELGKLHGHLHITGVVVDADGVTKLTRFGGIDPTADAEALDVQPGGLSPESTVGQRVGAYSDLFSWGALMYELCAADLPFGPHSAVNYAQKVRTEKPPPLYRKRPDLPEALLRLIDRCLRKSPAERPARASHIADELAPLLATETSQVLRQQLTRLKLTDSAQDDRAESEAVSPLKDTTRTKPDRLPWPWLLGATAVLLSVASGVFLWWNRTHKEPAPFLAKPQMESEEPLLLRVVASPWAHVFVDGTKRETTPFAQPIGLAPGSHLVRLEHPAAAAEERVVEGAAGQVVLLNVQMHVQRPPTISPETVAEQEDTSP